ncbi:glycosyltransferase family 2 protein [Flavobacteriaceae bacterium LMO-SS05]
MAISIITPHFNQYDGLQRIYEGLIQQSSTDWEWIIVDDCSEAAVVLLIKAFFNKISNPQIHVICNDTKSNASVCRNAGIAHAQYSNLVFLDADDTVSEHFVANRLIAVEQFAVFPHYFILNEKGEVSYSPSVESNYLDYFLKAHFIWQTTAVLWNKRFLIELGTFDPNLGRLQDVELAIRSLYYGKDFKVLDNVPDFYYHVKPIRTRTNFVETVCISVQYIISEIDSKYQLKDYQKKLLKGYYYLCVKYLQRSQGKDEVVYVRRCLNLFYSKNYMSLFNYSIGHILLVLFKFELISKDLFIRTNRYFFKPRD